MAPLQLDTIGLLGALEKISSAVDFKKDLPLNVFLQEEYVFWFFERPLLSYLDLLSGLISENFRNFGSDVFIKFSGAENLVGSGFSIDGQSIDRDLQWLSKESQDFFCGAVGYPLTIFNGSCDWIAFESAYEEFGVIAVKASSMKAGFADYLDSSFISRDEIVELALSAHPDSGIAKVFLASYNLNVKEK